MGYYENGTKQAKAYYAEGRPTDTVFCYYPSGKLKRILVEIDTVLNYWKGTDYFENGNKMIEAHLRKDRTDNWIIQDEWIERYPNGRLKRKALMKDNSSIGKWTEWDKNGNVAKISDKSFKMSL